MTNPVTDKKPTMPQSGAIILIDDDEDDTELMMHIINEMNLKNEFICFANGRDALSFLETTTEQPFLIFCDINMPIMNGIELRKTVNKNDYLREKSIPFVFLTTTAVPAAVSLAYELNVQGFFVKAADVEEHRELIHHVVNYWRLSKHPNNSK